MADVSQSSTGNAHPGARPIPALLLLATCLALAFVWFASQRPDNPLLGAATEDPDTPRLASKISDLAFGDVGVGASEEQRFVLFHEGSSSRPLTVFNAWLAEPDALHFSTDFEGPITLQPGESLALTVRFAPQADGSWTSPLYISHDGESGIEIFTLSASASAMTEEQQRRERAAALQRRARPDFTKSTLSGIGNVKPTSLQFGPDGRLYVADLFGAIRIYTVERRGRNDYHVQQTETILSIRDIPNHDDDGDPAPKISNRLVTGLLVVGTESAPVIYVASSDPRIGGGPSHTDTNLDTNSGVISRLTRQGNGWKRLDLVRGLSRSEENHHPNGMVLDEGSNRLYVAAGGNTNLGGPSNNFVRLPEYALSAAILEIDLGAIGNRTYDLPTLDDDSRPGSDDRNDPFGGNDGKNQAKLVPGGPVQVYAPGFRNAYDIVLTDDGRMYTVDNGGNSGWGGPPEGGSHCSNALSEPGRTQYDKLHYISERGYYGGHPNPTRGNQRNTFNRDGQSPVSVSNPIECVFRGAGRNQSADTFNNSVNGLAEYRASNFDANLQGGLLAVGFDNTVHLMRLNDNGSSVTDRSKLFSNVGGIPLDIVAQADWQIFPGTIWIADFQKKDIIVFEPRDFDGTVVPKEDQGCSTDPDRDNDGDGFSNADETANGTDPCSAADLPSDADRDGVSDLLDRDDDNDGLDDVDDPFALDTANGRGTPIPLDFDWENDSTPPGFLLNLGFSGLISDGETDWRQRFDTANMTVGGAAGVLTIDAVPPGDAFSTGNSQDYGFQFGIDVDSRTLPFVVHTRIVAPFSGASRKPFQSLGFYIGTGDQDNYIKLVANTNGPRGGVQLAREIDASFTDIHNGPAAVYDTESVDLFLRVDPKAGDVRAYHLTRDQGVDGPLVAIGEAVALPRDWLASDTALAVGLIATSNGTTPFTATWDFVRVSGTGGVDAAGGSPAPSGTPNAKQPAKPSDPSRDTDGDGLADTDDDDDDDDGVTDDDDAFALDAANGRTTPIPMILDWGVPGGATGFLSGLGFSGLMNDGSTGWQQRIASSEPIVDRTAGTLRIDRVSSGDAFSTLDSQDHGLQFGIDVGIDTPPFVVHTRLVRPLATASRKPWQSLGLYVGTGDQDNYVKLVANTNGARGGIQLAAEREGVFDSVHNKAASVYDTESVDLYLRIDPQAGQARAFHRSRENGVDGPLIAIGASAALPPGWLNSQAGLAVGIIATSTNADPFGASWDFIRVDDAGALDAGSLPGTGGGPGTDGADGADDKQAPVAPPGGDSTDGTGGDASGGAPGGATGATDGSGPNGGIDSGGEPSASSSTVLVIEAEAALRNVAAGVHAWQRIGDPAAVGGASMRALPDSGALRAAQSGSPVLDFPIRFPAAGRWYVWVRGKGDTDAAGEGKNDSVHVGLNGTLTGGTAIDRFPDAWTWSRSTRAGARAYVDVPSSGDHTVNVWMREDGFELDRVVLSSDAAYAPSGGGPRAGAGTAPVAGPVTGSGSDAGSTTDAPTATPVEGDGNASTGTNDGVTSSSRGVLRIDALDAARRTASGAHAWQPRADGALVALPDSGTLRPTHQGSPALDYRVNFDRAGTWTVWVHGFGDENGRGEGRNDSVHVGLDGSLAGAAAMDGFPPAWTWSRSRRSGSFATVDVDRPGEHTLTVWMREDGFAFDRLTLIGPGAAIDHPSEDPGSGGSTEAGDTRSDAGTDATTGSSAATGTGSTAAADARLAPGATWTRRTSADGSTPVARHEGGGIEHQGKLYVLGGRGKRAVSIFDPKTDRWTTGATPPIELNHFQPVVWDDRIWVVGAMTGAYPREPSVPDVYVYTPATDSWSKGPSIPAARRRGSMGAAVRGDRIYLLGGNTRGHDGGAVAWFDEFDPATGAWRVLEDAPNARDHAPVGIIGDRLIAAAGRRSTQPNVFRNMLGAVDVFDFTRNRWETSAPIPTRRAGTMVVTLGEELIVIGGESAASSQALDSVEAYDAGTRTWRKLDALAIGRHGGGAAVLDDAVHVASGNITRGGGNESTTHESLRISR